MARGRPSYSNIRQNIVDILFFLKKGYGYQIHKIYKKIFESCTNEVIYYHLKKGVALEEFILVEVKSEKGEFSWGKSVDKKYYELGPNSKPKMSMRVKEDMEKEGFI